MSRVDRPDEPEVSEVDDLAVGGGGGPSDPSSTAEINLDHGPDAWPMPDEVDETAPVPVGRHREQSKRPPVLAAAAAALGVAAVLIAVSALSGGTGTPGAVPSTSPRPVATTSTIAALPPSIDPAVSATPDASPTPSVTTAPPSTAPVATTAPTLAPPQPAGPTLLTVSPQVMTLTAAPGRCFDLDANLRFLGNVVKSWECNRTEAQRWSYNADHTLSAGSFCVGPVTTPPTAGTLLQIGTCGGGDVQWRFRSDGRLVNPASGLCVTDPGWATGEGRQLALAQCDGPGQQWTITSI